MQVTDPAKMSLVDVIKTWLLGVDPDDQDVVLGDDDWHKILAALAHREAEAVQVKAEPDFAASIADVIKEESANEAACGWRSCTGCHETNEGVETGHYPRSKMFGCHVGSGCSECGGLGAVWEYYSKDALDDMARDTSDGPALVAPPAQEPVAAQIADAVLSWMVKYDLLDAGNDYGASEVLAVLNDLAPSERPAPPTVPGGWIVDRETLAEAASDPSLSDGAVRALCVARSGEITDEVRAWAARSLTAAQEGR